jgi:hypothetical protein
VCEEAPRTEGTGRKKSTPRARVKERERERERENASANLKDLPGGKRRGSL